MADGRFVSKSIAHDWELNRSVSVWADYLFSRCIPHLDREGRMPGHPGEVKAIAVPIREEMTPDLIDACLGELARAGLVLWYQVDGKAALWFKGFVGNQKNARLDREGASKLPPPNHPRLQRVSTLVRSNSAIAGVTPPEGKGREVKLREVKGSEESLPAAPALPRAREDASRLPALPAGEHASEQAANGDVPFGQEPLEALIAYLGEDVRPYVLTVAAMPGTGTAWAQSLYATWGPRGSMEGDRVPSDLRAEVLGLAFQRYATDRQRWYRPGFVAFVNRALSDLQAARRAREREQDRQSRQLSAAEIAEREEADKRRLEAEGREIVGERVAAIHPSSLVHEVAARLGDIPPRVTGTARAPLSPDEFEARRWDQREAIARKIREESGA